MRRLIERLALLWMFGMTLVLYLTWWLAFFNGGTTTFSINMYGEMWPEYVMWMIVTSIMVVGLHSLLERD